MVVERLPRTTSGLLVLAETSRGAVTYPLSRSSSVVRSTQKATAPIAGSSAMADRHSTKTSSASRPVPQASIGFVGSSPGSRTSCHPSRGCFTQLGQSDTDPVGDVDQHRSLPTGVMDCPQACGWRTPAGGEQFEGVGHLVHRLHPVDPMGVEESLIDRVIPRQRLAVGGHRFLAP